MIQDEAGLLGISGAAADKARAGQLMNIFCEHFAMLATVPVRYCASSCRPSLSVAFPVAPPPQMID